MPLSPDNQPPSAQFRHPAAVLVIPIMGLVTILCLAVAGSLVEESPLDPPALERALIRYYEKGYLTKQPPIGFLCVDAEKPPEVLKHPGVQKAFKESNIDLAGMMFFPEGGTLHDKGFVNSGLRFLDACVELANRKYGKSLKGYQFNSPPDSELINIYFITVDPEGVFRRFRNNCAYIGHKNIIICDANYVDNHLNAIGRSVHEHGRREGVYLLLSPAYSSASAAGIWLWFIGHEIGHIAHNHGLSHLGSSDLFQRIDPKTALQGISVEEAFGAFTLEEAAADRFPLEVLASLKEKNRAIITNLHIALNSYIVDEINRRSMEQGIVEDGGIVVTAKRKDLHAPFLIRAIHMDTMLRQSSFAPGSTRDEIIKRVRVKVE